jgi:hypothetical protein
MAFLALLLASTPGAAQDVSVDVPCAGKIDKENTSEAVGTNGFLQYNVVTSVGVNACVIGVYVEADVVGLAGSGLHNWGFFGASARRQVGTGAAKRWTTNGKHQFNLFGLKLNAGTTVSYADTVFNVRAELDCSSMNGGGNYYVWDPGAGQCVEFFGSPIIIDMGREGYRLTSVRTGVMFDLDGDSEKEQVAWTHHRAENAFLALDRNGNGRIDSGAELFGQYTPVNAEGVTTPNGFEALKFFNGMDDAITDTDAIFGALLLWTDRNHDGESTPDELQSAADAGIAAISLKYRDSRREDRFGNEFRVVAKLTWANGRKDNVYDVWLKRQ